MNGVLTRRTAQSSIEYLIIVGFALTVIAILTLVYYEHDTTSKLQIAQSQVDRIARKIVDSSESVFFVGAPTRTTLKVYLPSGIYSIILKNKEVNFRVRSQGKISDMDYVSQVNVTGNITPTEGIKYIKIVAQQNRVCIIEEGMPECS